MIRIEATYREYPDLPETITVEIEDHPTTTDALVSLIEMLAVVARRAHAETGAHP